MLKIKACQQGNVYNIALINKDINMMSSWLLYWSSPVISPNTFYHNIIPSQSYNATPA